MKEAERKLPILNRIVLFTVLSIGAILFSLPLIWMLFTAVKAPSEVFSQTRFIPSQIHWENFKAVFEQPTLPFARFFLNTTIITLFVGIFGLTASSFVAFGFARLKFAGRETLFMAVLATMMVPWVVIMIPQFVIFQKLGWIDTLLPLTIPSLAGSAFQIFFLRQFFMTLPEDLFEAARIDGCSNFRICWSIAIPLAKPTIATLAIFSFLNSWNDFMGPIIYLQSIENRTLAIGLAMFSNMFGTQWNLLMAAATIAVIPILVIFFSFQRYFEKGLVMSGLKG